MAKVSRFGFVDAVKEGDQTSLLKDIAYNLRRLVLLMGGGQWSGTKSVTIKPKQYLMIEYVSSQTSVLLNIANPEDKEVWLFNDTSYAKDEATLKQNSFPLYPGKISYILLEYKEGIYVYNPNEEPLTIKFDRYTIRTCFFGL